MPEGDTIWKTARTLRGVLRGRPVTRFSSPDPRVAAAARRLALVGQTVADVAPIGKHLLVHFSGGAALHTHLGMHGSWHTYRLGTPWRKSPRAARAVIETAEVLAVCFGAPLVELLSAAEAAAHPGLRALGPDLLAADVDAAAARAGLRAHDQVEIGVALLDQTALAGIGNVYKSEILFLERVDPFVRVAALEDGTLDRLIATAVRVMRLNLGPGTRHTRPRLSPEPLWVYGRAGQPCRRCGAPVQRARQGEQRRSTYWCPRCQRSAAGAP
ncbi:MAG: DNA-formamidopyrimidine glycosylase family protein [Candidatus Methylomirabilales bacterium]